MLELLLMRHAKSDWSDESASDEHRVLNARGVKAAPRMGLWIEQADLVPDLVLCSTATRARQTAELVTQSWNADVPVCHARDLYHASPETMIRVVRSDSGDASRVMVVAHNPGLEVLAGHFSGACGHFPTAALIALRFGDLNNWLELSLSSDASVLASNRPKAL